MYAGRTVSLVTVDGVHLNASWWAAAPIAGRPDTLVVFVPGFTGHGRVPAVRRLVVRLRRRVDVMVVELRGHGRSGGRSTLGAREADDVAAAVEWGRRKGYRRVVTVGFSFGAAMVVCHAALRGAVDAVAAVSGPARWYVRDTTPMRALHVMVQSLPGRLVGRFFYGVRLGRGWDDIPPSPVELAHRIAPTPLLLVHGDSDHYFPIEHAMALAAAAGPNARVWIEPGFAHAENRLPPSLADRLAAWLVDPIPAAPGPISVETASGTIET